MMLSSIISQDTITREASVLAVTVTLVPTPGVFARNLASPSSSVGSPDAYTLMSVPSAGTVAVPPVPGHGKRGNNCATFVSWSTFSRNISEYTVGVHADPSVVFIAFANCPAVSEKLFQQSRC